MSQVTDPAPAPIARGFGVLPARRIFIAGGAALVLITLIAFLPAFRAGFIWDDDWYVTNNRAVRDGGASALRQIWTNIRFDSARPGEMPQYYPLTFSTFWLEYRLWGARPAGYHALNILLHVSSALLVWIILRRLAVPGAWLAAAIFAMHPVCVESVAWVTERKNALSAVMYLLALLIYLPVVGLDETRSEIADRRRRRRWAIAFALFLAALLAKTVASSLPAAILLLVYWKRGRIRWADAWPLIPFFVCGAGLGLVTSAMERLRVGASGPEWDFSLADRLLIAGRAVWFYAGKIVWPSPIIFVYPRWRIDPHLVWQWLFPIAAIVVVAVLWAMRKRIGRGPLVAVLFFGGTLFPALGFVNTLPMRFSFVADHFQYVASIGVIVLIVASATRWTQQHAAQCRAIVWSAASAVLVVLATLTFRQSRAYASAETLYRDTIAKNPSAAMAHTNLGLILYGRGEYEAAIGEYRAALDNIAANDRSRALMLSNLGKALSETGGIDESIALLKQAIETDPHLVPAYFNLGWAQMRRGDLAAAKSAYEQALALNPQYADACVALAMLLEKENRDVEAAELYERAVGYAQTPFALVNVGRYLFRAGRVEDAMTRWTDALEADPSNTAARQNLGFAHDLLGVTLLREGHREEAIAHFRQAVALNPDYATSQQHLNEALAPAPPR